MATGVPSPIQPTFHPYARFPHDMGVDLIGSHRAVAEELLDRPNIVPTFQQMGREGMPQGVATGGLGVRWLADSKKLFESHQPERL